MTQRKETNSKLLQILAKRDRHRLISREDPWPGQRRPSFASTIKIKHHSQPSQRPQRIEKNIDPPLFTNNRLQMSRRNAKSLCAINTITIRMKSDSKNMMDYATLSKKSIGSHSKSKKLKSSESESKVINIDTDDYVIDYLAFNYIGKVIDTPELWSKFVHKKLAL